MDAKRDLRNSVFYTSPNSHAGIILLEQFKQMVEDLLDQERRNAQGVE